MLGIERRQIEERRRELSRLRVEAESAQPEEDRSLLNGPHGAPVVAQGVVERVR
jgi:hypothetical protein